jgi:predicted membrane protein
VAEYFNVDPVLVRIAAVVLALTGPGIIAYALAWVFVPEASGPARPSVGAPTDRHDRGAQIFGIVLLAVSVSILWGGWWSPARRWFFPLGLMALGAWLLLRRDREDEPRLPGTPPGGPYPWAGAVPASAPATPPTATPDAADDGDADANATLEASLDPTLVGDDATTELPTTEPDADAGGGGAAGLPPWDHRRWAHGRWGHTPWGPLPEISESALAARRRRRLVFPIVMGALVLWTGLAFLLGVSLQTGLAVALCVVGLGFVLGAFVGGSRALIVPAVLVGAALIATSVLDVPFNGPIGRRTWTPQTIGDVEDHYELSIGEGILDLTEVPLRSGQRLPVRATIGIGHLVIQVPAGVDLDVQGDASGGDIELFGRSSSGMGVSVDRSFSGDADAGAIDLDLEVGLGHIEVVAVPPGLFDEERGTDLDNSTEPTTPSTTTTLG